MSNTIPSYHYANALDVAKRIKSLMDGDSIVFGVTTDNHVCITLESHPTYPANTQKSTEMMAFALEEVCRLVNADFIVNLGDNQWDNNIDTTDGLASMSFVNTAISSVFNEFLSFRIPGNHDQSSTFGKVYDYVGTYNTFDSVVTTPKRGYGYKDLADKKIRLICLNTSDFWNATGGYGMSYEQKQFLMSALDLSAKLDCPDWRIILFSHFPLDFPTGDYNTPTDIQSILNAYVAGNSVSIAVNSSHASAEGESISGTISYDYTNKNGAKIIANFHGHIHNHCFGKMATNNITRVCSPNTCFYLEKSTSYGDGRYDAPIAYPKTLNTPEETAVTFYVVNTVKEEVYSIVYGAGYNREIPYYNGTPTPFPDTKEVGNLEVAVRSNWEVRDSGGISDTTKLNLANANTQIAVGTSTATGLDYQSRNEGSDPQHVISIIQVPLHYTGLTVTCSDSSLKAIRFTGLKVSGSTFEKKFDTGFQENFSCSFKGISVDYLTIAVEKRDGNNNPVSISSSQVDDYPKTLFGVTFSRETNTPTGIASQLLALGQDKTDIAAAITAKGGTLSQNAGFDTFASDIATIPTGGITVPTWTKIGETTLAQDENNLIVQKDSAITAANLLSSYKHYRIIVKLKAKSSAAQNLFPRLYFCIANGSRILASKFYDCRGSYGVVTKDADTTVCFETEIFGENDNMCVTKMYNNYIMENYPYYMYGSCVTNFSLNSNNATGILLNAQEGNTYGQIPSGSTMIVYAK